MLTYAMTVILLVIVVIAFVGTPALGSLAGGSRVSFGSYAGREIVYEPGNYLARQYQDLARRVQEEDQEITDDLVRQIWQAAFQRAVFHEAMMVLAEESGVSVTSEEVDRAVAQWPEFQRNGRFDAEAYNSTSNQVKFALREYLREVLIDSQVQTDLYGETPASDAETQFLLSMAGPERQFNFIQFSFSDYPDSEVIDYGESVPQRFERINLSVITINSSEADAQSVREQALNRETSFEDLARNQSRDTYASDGGEMGWVYYHELEPDFEDPSVIDEIFSLEEGAISPVFRTTFGWTIYRVNEAPIEPDFGDSAVIAAVRDYMTVFERGLIEDYLSERGDEFVAQARSEGFAAASSELDQAPQQTSYFPVNYGNTPYYSTVGADTNETLAAAAFREEFFEELFALGDGDVSDPIVVRDYVFVFELADERSPNEQTVEFLESYLPLIVREFTQEQAQETFVDDDLLVNDFTATYNQAILGR
ncbi:MAG: peptidylprolyl isomerase [Spirochaetota bacterium]